ncbi:MAG TPA: iron uptake porin [Stenomitos sp.]
MMSVSLQLIRGFGVGIWGVGMGVSLGAIAAEPHSSMFAEASFSATPQLVAENTTHASEVTALESTTLTEAHFAEGFSPLITDVNEGQQDASQVTSVSQLSDVQPTDWAFQALQSLVERYGCIAGYPDGTFRGNRAATRYELAAALNACLDQISDRFATKEDLETVKALQQEFKAELATLKGRVDSLEARAQTLQAQQFSTTTKLTGEAVFLTSQFFSSDGKRDVPVGTPTVDDNSRPTFGDRLRLNFDTSFTGLDQLRIRLQARNIQPLDATKDAFGTPASTGTNMTRLSVDGNENNTVTLDDLYYRFPIGSNGRLTVIANSGDFFTSVKTFNPYLESDSTGTISRFGRFNPIYRFGDTPNSAGAVFNYKFNKVVAASFGYLADRPANATGPNGGFLGGSYSGLAQLELQLTRTLGVGLTYVHAFQESADSAIVNLTGSTGSQYARRPFGNSPTTSDSAGLEINAKIKPWLNLSGWAGYTWAAQADSPTNAKAEVLNWALAVAFPDLFHKGNLGAIIFGQPPQVVRVKDDTGADIRIGDFYTSYHLEALYRININNNISITPGVVVVFNPEGNANNGTDFVPLIRTTFRF